MTLLLIIIGLLLWTAAALAVGVLLGRTMDRRDHKEEL